MARYRSRVRSSKSLRWGSPFILRRASYGPSQDVRSLVLGRGAAPRLANTFVLPRTSSSTTSIPFYPSRIPPRHNFRLFNKVKYAPAANVLTASSRSSSARKIARFDALADNSRVRVCVARNTRKQVLFAFGKTGRSGRQSRPNYTSSSTIFCS